MIQIPQAEGLATGTMNRIFDNTAATYKFYWLLSLLDMHVRERQTVMPALDVAARMVAYAWYPVEYFRLSPLLKNVPYRFLSPWIPFTCNEDVVAKSNNPETRCPYSLHDDHIEVNASWGDYLIANYEKMTEFVEQELCAYLKMSNFIE